MLIKKINDKILGEIKINFSTKSNLFEVFIPRPRGFVTTIDKLDTWEKVETYIAEIKDATMYETKFIKKIIYLDFKSSEDEEENKFAGQFNKDNRKLSDEVAFKLNWYVCDEFETKHHNIFKIVESYGNNGHVGKTNILGQLFYGSGQELEYSEDLYNFLIDYTYKLKDIIKRLSEYLNKDSKILLDNIFKNQLKLE